MYKFRSVNFGNIRNRSAHEGMPLIYLYYQRLITMSSHKSVYVRLGMTRVFRVLIV